MNICVLYSKLLVVLRDLNTNLPVKITEP